MINEQLAVSANSLVDDIVNRNHDFISKFRQSYRFVLYRVGSDDFFLPAKALVKRYHAQLGAEALPLVSGWRTIELSRYFGEPVEALESRFKTFRKKWALTPKKVDPKFWYFERSNGIDLNNLPSNTQEVEEIINRIRDEDITECLQLILKRIGQSKFRKNLLKRDGKCVLTGIRLESVLIASHIKGWSDSDDSERLDTDNGLLMSATYDRLFDAYLISFNDDGSVIFNRKLAKYKSLTEPVKHARIQMSANMRQFMKHHREKFLAG